MTTTTLTALNTGPGVDVRTVVLIEGYKRAFTDAESLTQILAALAASAVTGHTDYVNASGGLSVKWDQQQSAGPWKPFAEPPMLSFKVYPDRDETGAATDAFGVEVAKRTSDTETFLADDLPPDETTTLTVASTDAFDSSGYVHLGPERIAYTSTGAGTITGLTRGINSPFAVESGARFARRHEIQPLTTETGPVVGVRLQPRVTAEPISWLGRWVGVYLALKTSSGFVASDQWHLAFAGKIAAVSEGENGEVAVVVKEVRAQIFETQIMRDPFKAKLKEGITLKTGDTFSIKTSRDSTVGNGNDLVVVASGASGSNQLDAGLYTADEIGTKLLSWMLGERVAGRILLNVSYFPTIATDDGVRGYLAYDDATDSSSGPIRRVGLYASNPHVLEFLGWGESAPSPVVLIDGGRSGHVYSPHAPLRFSIFGMSSDSNLLTLEVSDPSGTFEQQGSLLPPALRGTSNEIDGVLKIGGLFYVRVVYTSDTSFTFTSAGLDAYFPGAKRIENAYVTYDEEDALDVTQVVLIEGSFASVVPSVLISTGTADYNAAGYDALGAQLGCAVPYSLLGDDFIAEIGACQEANSILRVYVEQPTRFADLFNVDFILRGAFFAWGNGRLHLGSWSTPTTTYATVTLTEADKAEPVGTVTLHRATGGESIEDIRNVVKVNYGRDATGALTSELSVIDAGSVRDHGSQGITLDARNAAQVDVRDVLASFSGGLPMWSRPYRVIRRSVNFTKFVQCRPGTLVTVSDDYIRNPTTGLRGITGWPAIVIASRHEWGGVEAGPAAPITRQHGGEVQLMLLPRQTSAPYAPCAQFRGSNYDSGTFTASCLAHEHSESTSAVDASHFADTDVVLITEIDPSNASAPLQWQRTITAVSGNDITFDSDLTSPAFDSAKLYRITSASYSAATATQKTDTYQADDADYLVEDLRQPYGLMYCGAGQAASFTLSASTELPERHSTLSYGDGVALDTGYDRAIARGLNNLVDYKTAICTPTMVATSEARTHAGSGTWDLVAIFPIDFGMRMDASCLLYVAPMFKSTDGTTATVRVTLGKLWPQGSTRYDVTHLAPYQQVSFSTTSTSYAVATAQTLSTAHCNRTGDALGGRGWVAVEINSKANYLGLARCQIGPRVTASPPLIHWRRSACNGMHPETAFYAQCVSYENRLTGEHHKAAFAKTWDPNPANWAGVTGTATLARFRFRSSHGSKRLRLTAVIGLSGSGTNPQTTISVTKVGGSTTDWVIGYGVANAAKTGAPTEWTIVNRVIDIDPAAAYTVTVTTSDYAVPFAVTGMELGPSSIDESTDYGNQFIAQADAPILDTVRSRLMLGVGNMLRQNGGLTFHWSLSDGSARTRTSATAVNLLDNSTSGSPTSATPGVSMDLTYRNTASRTTVPCELAVYGSIPAGSGTVTLVDSGGTALITVTVNNATPQWFTATGSLDASAAKYDLQFKGDGTNAISVYAVSGGEYEA